MVSPALSDKNIALVVDDDPDSLLMVSAALEENGMSVIVARDGITAIDLVGRIQPDVILMDAIMPNMDGFETCRKLTKGAHATNAPIIFMTGLTEPDDVVRGLKAGGIDYITKPIVVDELVARISTHIVNAKLIQSARDAHDLSGASLLAFDKTGALVWGSKLAISAFEVPADQKDALQTWVTACATTPAQQIDPFPFADGALRYLGLSHSSEILVHFSHKNEAANETTLEQFFSLTARESQVLYWLTLGKTNKDISVILDLSPRTVNKHLEQIYQKMGVDNRTSAAVTADRVLHL